ncbi:type II toxin-antitoxin system RelE/ParE family toxin [Rhizobium sp. RU36D]|uniref:type II toxin-antitoxin system RelE family toxin n=1 Tax=Rhizobium sp. RU36D TaxID=1907415 RepID=UPI0009D88BB2|nr:type II toxin-antitoxin system RelE/ParE family toxin [Rhizobium sp. RU36D]SMD16682.1 mRNA interferase RelE/StbE [Rhizobium sp. RU36D]
MAWTIEFDDKAIKQLKKLGDTESRRIRNFLHTRIKPLDYARQHGRPLRGQEFNHLWRYQVGDYRIICDIQDQKLVVLVI